MDDLGPGARRLVECAAVVQVARDALEATLLLKRLASGLRLVDLTPPGKRAEASAILTAMCCRCQAGFDDWARRTDLPEVEAQAALDAFESCWSAGFDGAARSLTPAASARATLETALKACAERDPVMRADLITRDIVWALVEAALSAAAGYAQPLGALELTLNR